MAPASGHHAATFAQVAKPVPLDLQHVAHSIATTLHMIAICVIAATVVLGCIWLFLRYRRRNSAKSAFAEVLIPESDELVIYGSDVSIVLEEGLGIDFDFDEDEDEPYYQSASPSQSEFGDDKLPLVMADSSNDSLLGRRGRGRSRALTCDTSAYYDINVILSETEKGLMSGEPVVCHSASGTPEIISIVAPAL